MMSPVMQDDSPVIGLTEQERELVRAQRVRLHGALTNGEFPSVVLRPRKDGEVDIVYASSKRVRRSRNVFDVVVQAVGLTSSDASRIAYRNLRLYQRSGYCVDSWAAPCNGRAWGYTEAKPDGTGDIPGPVANPGALAGTRYRYAGLDERCWGIRPAAYLRALRKHPEAEILHKADLDQLITPSILGRGRDFARFIARNADAIREADAGPASVVTAFRHNLTIEQAVARIRARTAMRCVPLPDGLTAEAALLYCMRARIETWEYKRHALHCAALGLGTSAWTPSPKRFRKFAEEVEEMFAKENARKEERKMRRLSSDFKKRMASFAALVRAPRGIRVVVPTSLEELASEGAAMHNCIGNGIYFTKCAKGKSLIAFLREASTQDTPWCDVEFSLDNDRWTVAQCYAKYNASAPETAVKAADTLCAALNKEQRKRRSNLKKGA